MKTKMKIKKTLIRSLTTLLTVGSVLCILLIFSSLTFAANGTQDGITAEITVDKDSYEPGDTV